MQMDFSRMERVVGTFIVGVIVLLLATLVIIGRGKDWFEAYTPYTTFFKESYNLQENAAVKLFSADIGKVTDIIPEKNRVQVKLAIMQKYASRIRKDTVAVVESPTLIGSEYVSIIPGSPDSPLIPPKGRIASREKKSLTELLTEFQVEKTAKMVVQAMQDISELSVHLSDPKGPLLTTLNNMERISSNVDHITATIEAGKGPMGLLLKSENLLQHMMEIIDHLNAASAKAPPAMALVEKDLALFQQTGQSLQASMEQARQILADVQKAATDLQVVMQNVKAGSYNVPQITTTFKDGIREIRQGVEQANRVVEAMQKSILIRSNLPPAIPPARIDAGARP